MQIKDRIKTYIKSLDISIREFEKKVGKSNGYVNNIVNTISADVIVSITNNFPNLNINWLLTGEGEMLKGDEIHSTVSKKNIIPLYDDVRSVGGHNDITASTGGVSSPSDYIDAGDWFTEATAAVRHYGDSMLEYPPGCILAIKAVLDRNLILPGHDYVIETNEYRITKKIQLGEDYIRAYSTNTEKYEDGTLIHQPFNIPLASINRMFLVLGYVVKKNGGSIIVNAASR